MTSSESYSRSNLPRELHVTTFLHDLRLSWTLVDRVVLRCKRTENSPPQQQVGGKIIKMANKVDSLQISQISTRKAPSAHIVAKVAASPLIEIIGRPQNKQPSLGMHRT